MRKESNTQLPAQARGTERRGRAIHWSDRVSSHMLVELLDEEPPMEMGKNEVPLRDARTSLCFIGES